MSNCQCPRKYLISLVVNSQKKILKVITDPGEISLKSEILCDKTLNASDPQSVGHREWILKCTLT